MQKCQTLRFCCFPLVFDGKIRCQSGLWEMVLGANVHILLLTNQLIMTINGRTNIRDSLRPNIFITIYTDVMYNLKRPLISCLFVVFSCLSRSGLIFN